MSLYSPPSSRSTDLFTPPHVLPPFSSSSFRSPCLSLPLPSSPFPHLFHHSSAPFLSSCPTFFLSLCYSLLFPLLTLLLLPSFFFPCPCPLLCLRFFRSVPVSPSLCICASPSPSLFMRPISPCPSVECPLFPFYFSFLLSFLHVFPPLPIYPLSFLLRRSLPNPQLYAVLSSSPAICIVYICEFHCIVP